MEGWPDHDIATKPSLQTSLSVSEICTSAAALQLAQGLLFHEDIQYWSTCPANSLTIILITLSTSKTQEEAIQYLVNLVLHPGNKHLGAARYFGVSEEDS